MPEATLTTLAHYIDVEWLKEAYKQTRKDGAVGVDGESGEDYGEELDLRLKSLLNRAKLGDLYRAPPVRRVYIPKDGGGQRPLGIPTFEDKVLQRAIKMVMEAIYEQDFLPCSFGFRPGRSQHQALETMRNHVMSMRGGWVADLDIKAFFDSVDHKQLMAMIRERVRDGVILRLIGKWLQAGVMEEGNVYYPENGTPQGGVISPLLANIYLHVVTDVWFEKDVKPCLVGRAEMVRFADDILIIFERETDARRVMEVIPKRLQRYNLKLNPDKTRLVRFERPPKRRTPRRSERPETFNFLGFTHYCSKTRKGWFTVKRKTVRKRIRKKLKEIKAELKRRQHDPIPETGRWLGTVVAGFFNHNAVPFNYRSLVIFRDQVVRLWKRVLERRSQKGNIAWERMARIKKRYLPKPRIRHPYPDPSLLVMT
ncbi:MAG: group II intron reverse transcriptase/maturase [Candidatus Omnitrophica bacterium]|nr:group II intron reverse transcriptase/maturase [Candidatus Omnitrophota bacterium]